MINHLLNVRLHNLNSHSTKMFVEKLFNIANYNSVYRNENNSFITLPTAPLSIDLRGDVFIGDGLGLRKSLDVAHQRPPAIGALGRLPAFSCLLSGAYRCRRVPGQGRDLGAQRRIGSEHTVVPMPMHPGRRHQGGDSVDQFHARILHSMHGQNQRQGCRIPRSV